MEDAEWDGNVNQFHRKTEYCLVCYITATL